MGDSSSLLEFPDHIGWLVYIHFNPDQDQKSVSKILFLPLVNLHPPTMAAMSASVPPKAHLRKWGSTDFSTLRHTRIKPSVPKWSSRGSLHAEVH